MRVRTPWYVYVDKRSTDEELREWAEKKKITISEPALESGMCRMLSSLKLRLEIDTKTGKCWLLSVEGVCLKRPVVLHKGVT